MTIQVELGQRRNVEAVGVFGRNSAEQLGIQAVDAFHDDHFTGFELDFIPGRAHPADEIVAGKLHQIASDQVASDRQTGAGGPGRRSTRNPAYRSRRAVSCPGR